MAASLVRQSAVFLWVRKDVELAVSGGEAHVPCQIGGGGPSVTVCSVYCDKGHV